MLLCFGMAVYISTYIFLDYYNVVSNGNSRLNPSDDFGNLIKMYEEKHAQGEGMFNGRSLLKFVDLIKAYLEANNCKSV